MYQKRTASTHAVFQRHQINCRVKDAGNDAQLSDENKDRQIFTGRRHYWRGKEAALGYRVVLSPISPGRFARNGVQGVQRESWKV